MKKFISLFSILNFPSTFAYTQIEAVNYNPLPLNIAFGYIDEDERIKFNEKNIYRYILEIEQRKYFTTNSFIIIENKNILTFMVNGVMCAYTNFLGTRPMTHGVGVNVFLNDEYKGTVCANKKSILDIKYNLKLTFQKDPFNVAYIQIINNGWWVSEEVYPKILTIKLN